MTCGRSGVREELVLSLLLGEETGELELKGCREKFQLLAARIRSGDASSIPLTMVDDPRPYSRSLQRIEIRGGSGKVSISLLGDRVSLLVQGGAESREVLAENIEAFARDATGLEHMHIEPYPDHYYLAEDSAAIVLAFEKAGMTNPDDVSFSKYDPETGTVVEFKGPGGAKVAYDGPHENPGPFHDSQHIGWQTAGKRGDPGWGRANIPYSGPQGPVRGSTPGWEDWWQN